MAKLSNAILTNSGINVLLNTLTGEALEFTKIVASEAVNSTDDIDTLEHKKTLGEGKKIEGKISKTRIEGNHCNIECVFENFELQEGIYLNEFGLFAKNRSGEEVLYAYLYAQRADPNDQPGDYLPSRKSETDPLVDHTITFYVFISNATNVKASISISTPAESIIYDNSKSGLDTKNVQDAIDRIAERVEKKVDINIGTTEDPPIDTRLYFKTVKFVTNYACPEYIEEVLQGLSVQNESQMIFDGYLHVEGMDEHTRGFIEN